MARPASAVGASVPLQTVGILTALIFLISNTFETLALHDLYRAQHFLIALLHGVLALWAIAEVVLLQRATSAIPLRHLQFALILQFLLGVARHLPDFSPTDPESGRILYGVAGELGVAAVFIPAYLVVFMTVSKLLINAFSHAERERANQLEAQIGLTEQALAALKEARIAAEAANEAKTKFLNNVSHEIRTPMNAIIGLSQSMLETAVDPQQASNLRTIDKSAQALLVLINDILDLAKVESGQLSLAPVEFSPVELLDEVLNLFRVSIAAKGLALVLDVDANVPRTVYADALRLRQILVNLIGNALKFTEHGQIAVRVGLATPAAGAFALTFAVRDSGIGIAAAQQAQLFQPFVQADASISRRYGGTGLGLSIARQLVELMGGHLTVDSALGQGSCFSFTTPVERPGAALAEQRPQPVVPVQVGQVAPVSLIRKADIAALLPQLAQLEQLLASNTLEAQSLAHDIQSRLAADGQDQIFKPICQAIDQLNFRAARTALAGFRTQFCE